MQKTRSSQFLLQSQRKQNISAHRRTPISSPSPSRKDYFNRSLQNKCTSPSFTRFVTKKLSSLFTAFLSCRNGGTERIKPEGKNQSHSKEISRSTNKSSKRFKYAGSKSSSNSTNTKNGVLFSIEEIYKATENFSPANKIGDGGFGTVYKGKLRDGTVVAIKRAQKNMYDKHLSAEFKTEIQTLSTIEHLNLVRLLGYLVVEKIMKLAMQCLENGRQSRPSMKKCAEVLWRIRKDFRDSGFSSASSISHSPVELLKRDPEKLQPLEEEKRKASPAKDPEKHQPLEEEKGKTSPVKDPEKLQSLEDEKRKTSPVCEFEFQLVLSDRNGDQGKEDEINSKLKMETYVY